MHDEADDGRVQVGNEEEPDAATDKAEQFNFVIATDAAGKAVRNLFMKAHNKHAGRHNDETAQEPAEIE